MMIGSFVLSPWEVVGSAFRLTDDPLDIMVNGKLIARGEVVAQGNRFAIRVLELVGASGEASSERRAPPITAAPVQNPEEAI
jgi:flagellar motor switch protein FliN/FliY